MAKYSVEFVRSARKEFERIPARIRSRITEALGLLGQNPYSELLKVKKLRAEKDLNRVRVSDYRVLYEIRKERLVVIVIKVGHRSDVYRK